MTGRNVHLVTALESEPAWRQERRNRIVAAAAELFNKAPFNSVQMDDIARVAGLGKPTLYRYFQAKDELFLAVFDEMLTALEADLRAVLSADQPPEAKISAMIRILVERLSTRLASLSILGGDQAGAAFSTRQLYVTRRQSLIDLLGRALIDGQAAGVFRDLDVPATAPMLLGLIRSGLLAAPDLPSERMTAAAIDLVLRGTLNQRLP